jgi:drug/metabolite transporter (DMT)-like permease
MGTTMHAGRDDADVIRASHAERRSWWLLGILVAVWGASWPVIKIGVATVPPVWFACLRYIVATACLVPIVAARGELRLPSSADRKLIVVSGVLQMAAYSALTAVALSRLPAGRSSVLAFSTPLWVALLAVLWLREPMPWLKAVGVSIGMSGVLTIASPGLRSAATATLLPYLLLIAAAAGWAVSIVFVRAHRFHASPLSLAPWQTLVAASLLLPCALGMEGAFPPVSLVGLVSLAYVGPIATAFAYWAVVEVGRYVGATTISMSLLAVPALGVVISTLAFHETVDVPLGLGVALVTIGVVVVTANDRRGASVRRPRDANH